MSAIIETKGLTKIFGGLKAIDHLDLEVPPRSIFGFLGRNGAGKTTTIKMLLGMVKPTSGGGHVLGHDISTESLAIRSRVAFVGEDKGLYEYMTVAQILRFNKSFYTTWREDLEQSYVRLFELPLNRKIKNLSKGMRTKVALLLALAQDADLLILDEPTLGLDPIAIEEVLRILVEQVGEHGRTLFFSSNQVAEVEQIADHVGIIDGGHLVECGNLDDLKANYKRIDVVFADPPEDKDLMFAGVKKISRRERVTSLLTARCPEAVLEQIQRLHPSSIDTFNLSLKEILLENLAPKNRTGENR